MSATATSFYQTGGTLRPDAPSYVERQADRDLHEGLTRGEFCYVLHSRQMGKSSLMARTAARLRGQGTTVLSLDLGAIGQNLSPEQWYDGLLRLIAWQLDLDEELEEFWEANVRLGPLQRWMGALREVVMPHCPGRVVIAVDEIDAVRSLPFSTDEFFAGIRECYNRRSEDPELARLTFCLLGVASPADLIRDTRTTPFNIGRRIDLTDFTPEEAGPLTGGLERKEPLGTVLLERVLYWTSGHPYLTQRLCQAVAGDSSVTGPAGVDRLCEEMFLSPQARERDDNLLFVRDWLLRSPADLAALLDLYGQVRRGKRVGADERNPLVSHLRLSGITRPVGSLLRVRNRIYARVFDREWITGHMPDAELRRQRAAYRRGLIRAAAVSAVILVLLAALALTAVLQARRADRQARRADRIARQEAQQRRLAEERLYAADIKGARQNWEAGNLRAALDLLEAQVPKQGQDDLRGFEWRYLWRLCHRGDELFTLRSHHDWVRAAFAPDGEALLSWSGDGSVKRWDLASRRVVQTMPWRKVGENDASSITRDRKILAWIGREGGIHRLDPLSGRQMAVLKLPWTPIKDIELSPDGRVLAARCPDQAVRLWNVLQRREVRSLRHREEVGAMIFSGDGTKLAVGSSDRGTFYLWDVASGREAAVLRDESMGGAISGAFSPDGRFIALAGYSGTVNLWDLATKAQVAALQGHKGQIYAIAFSPDGRTLATGGDDRTVRIWDVTTKAQRAILRGHADAIQSLSFAPDGKSLASGSNDHTVKLWRLAARPEAEAFHGHTRGISGVAFSPDGRLLASGGWDNTAKVWDLSTRRVVATLRDRVVGLRYPTFSPDGKLLAVGSGNFQESTHAGEVMLWDVQARRVIATWRDYPDGINNSLTFSPDGRTLATGGNGGTVKLRDLASGREVTFRGHRGWVGSVRFSPDGRTLASAGEDMTVRLWDVASQQTQGILKGHSAPVWSVAFSPDGKALATASWDHTVKLWDVTTRREIAALPGSVMACSVAFSPDGKTLAVGYIGESVKLWNLATRQEVADLEGPRGYAPVVFSTDGRFLASGSGRDDRSVLLWRAASFAETDAPLGAPGSR
jgi:WD40 repeat protein